MGYSANNKNADRLIVQLQYWGAWSFQQASYYLYRFFKINYSDREVRNICASQYLAYLDGRQDVVAVKTAYNQIVFNYKKDSCVWVFFRYLEEFQKNGQWPYLVSFNPLNGVNFTCMGKFYSMVFVDKDDRVYASIVKAHTEADWTRIYVTNSEEKAKKIAAKTINPDDKIWIVETVGGKRNIKMYRKEGNA